MPFTDDMDKVNETYRRNAYKLKKRNELIIIIAGIASCCAVGTILIYLIDRYKGF